MVLSHEEMKKIFENHGFSGFELRHYDDNMEKLLSFAARDNAKGYVIDVVPGGLQHGENEACPDGKTLRKAGAVPKAL